VQQDFVWNRSVQTGFQLTTQVNRGVPRMQTDFLLVGSRHAGSEKQGCKIFLLFKDFFCRSHEV